MRGELGLGVHCLGGGACDNKCKVKGIRKSIRTEGNGEVNVAKEGEVRGIRALRLDKLEESMGSLGESS